MAKRAPSTEFIGFNAGPYMHNAVTVAAGEGVDFRPAAVEVGYYADPLGIAHKLLILIV